MVEVQAHPAPPMLRVSGGGLLANAFTSAPTSMSASIFASGVSNSGETRAEAFAREEALLRGALAQEHGRFVYFSTCSIRDNDRASSPYAMHKKSMEGLVRSHRGHLILRLPQVVGHTANPHTLTNFLAHKLSTGATIEIWARAQRCLVDVEHVAAITIHLLEQNSPSASHDIAPPETVSMQQLVVIMEQATSQQARCTLQDRGGGSPPDPSLMLDLAPTLGIDISPGYTERVIRKYYGRTNA
ncbi:hypothetical protein Q6A26_14715 [Xanthomonas euvesicatoria pv. eucalypti]|uniref:NAD-dependent epimerase/dehydratase family protein n=1 Tax=Xanthomonas euvesicatoria TaxID=456327 RepID=UPI0026E45FAB|nr:NAD-dependent epimerase/dehydratase family protein [Xanthomonas euvesicatoria]MDO7946153.1 hypothetical protein [Xanthomonas euvesicatoria pv. eucalypti]MDO7954090.1 hypothetical protein [Xanthomonas euvesicatoria pv. eucalypti]